MKVAILFAFLALAATSSANMVSDTTDEPGPEPTENPGLPYGSLCNGLITRCNRHSNTVSCIQRRPETTEAPVDPTEDPTAAIFGVKSAPQDVCQSGANAILGRCQCSRNCKSGNYVEDGEFDPERQLCVGMAGSLCSLLVPHCTRNGHCNFFALTCVCDAGYVVDEERHCVPA